MHRFKHLRFDFFATGKPGRPRHKLGRLRFEESCDPSLWVGLAVRVGTAHGDVFLLFRYFPDFPLTFRPFLDPVLLPRDPPEVLLFEGMYTRHPSDEVRRGP
jgi:hypothetical protein